MNATKQALDLIAVAETSLQDLIQSEVAAGRYSELAELARLADGVARLVDKSGSIKSAMASETGGMSAEKALGTTDPENGLVNAECSSEEAKRCESRTVKKGVVKKGVVKKGAAKKSGKRGYPWFEVTDLGIDKIGWSKKKKSEYRHSAPTSAAIAFVKYIDATREDGKIWSVEDLGDIEDTSNGVIVPSYQVYLVIAWLRSIGLIAKNGRSGYSSNVAGGLTREALERLSV
tara:strand:+ start:61041 stop:61736 length:696 start_codon:yes stop_codon:yes gene_type:complete